MEKKRKREGKQENNKNGIDFESFGEYDFDELDDESGDSETDIKSEYEEKEGDGEVEQSGGKYIRKRKHEEEEESDSVIQPKKPSKKKKKTNMKPPTAEEMAHLRETENLFQSNLFRLQIEELMNETRAKKSSKQGIRPWIENFKKHLLNVDEISDLPLNRLKWLNQLGISPPLPKNDKEQKGVLNFFKPVEIKTFGSFKTGCLGGPTFRVDLAVVMPKKTFLKEDNLNQRYHLKRALYLSILASHIKKGDFISPGTSLQFFCPSGDPLKPCLIFRPLCKVSDYVEIVLHAIPQTDTFKLKRFAPEINNVRPAWWGLNSESDSLPATPMYNASVVEDLVVEENEALRSEVTGTNTNVKEAILLLRVWLKQRGLSQGYGCISPFIMSMYVVHLMRTQKLNVHMSSYQLIRNVWLSLTLSDWSLEGPSMFTSNELCTPGLTDFHSKYDVVFIDSTGFCNFTSRVDRLTYLKLKHEAELAMTFLDNPDINSFQALFIIQLPFLRQYDHIISFTEPIVLLETTKSNSSDHILMDYNSFIIPQFMKLVGKLLEKGLGKRASEIWFQINGPTRWDVSNNCTSHLLDDVFMIGIKLNSDFAFSLIDKGPQANMPEAVDFRAFWSNKSELRRFRDGNVCESVVWGEEGACIRERRLIVSKIVSFLLKNELKIFPNYYNYIADQFSTIISNKIIPSAENEETCKAIHVVLEELTQQLRDLTDLPLSIVNVYCISSVYRYTDVFPPNVCQMWMDRYTSKRSSFGRMFESHKRSPFYVSPIELVLHLSMSKKWPDDIGAGKRLLAAFNIAIARELKKKDGYLTQITTDNLIVQKSGYVFRISMGYSKEIGLLKRQITSEGVKKYRDTPESIELEKKFINLPKITGALHGLSQQYSGYGFATCIAKRWMCSQLFDDFHFPTVVIELLMANIFLSPQPFTPAIQPQTAFLRFLSCLATTDWNMECIAVNFNNLLSRQEISELEKHFTSERSNLPPMVVATPYDKTGTLWTKNAPTLPVLIRLAKLASTTLQILEIQLTIYPKTPLIMKIFKPPMTIYDAVIELNPDFASRRSQCISWKPSRLEKSSSTLELPILDFDPVHLYVKELRAHYSDFVLFFYDIYGGIEIGVLFKPSALEPKEFKVSNLNGRKPVKPDHKQPLKVDVQAMISDFYSIGNDLVKEIHIKKS